MKQEKINEELIKLNEILEIKLYLVKKEVKLLKKLNKLGYKE